MSPLSFPFLSLVSHRFVRLYCLGPKFCISIFGTAAQSHACLAAPPAACHDRAPRSSQAGPAGSSGFAVLFLMEFDRSGSTDGHSITDIFVARHCCNNAAPWCIPLSPLVSLAPLHSQAAVFALELYITYAHTTRNRIAAPATHCTRAPTWCSTGVF